MEHRPPLNSPPPSSSTRRTRSEWGVDRARSLPYLWTFKWRVLLALAFLVGAKLGNVGVPLVLKRIVDALSIKPTAPGAVLVLPVALLVAYGAAAAADDDVHRAARARVREGHAARRAQRRAEGLRAPARAVAALPPRTPDRRHDARHRARQPRHLVARRLSRCTASCRRWSRWRWCSASSRRATTSGSRSSRSSRSSLYIAFTITVTEWRTHFRRTMNELDSKANMRAIDSLLNYETVKYFNNEAFETRRYDESMQRWENAAVKSQTSLSMLNIGQAALIAIAVSLIMWRATVGVIAGTMTLGDLVLVNAFMIQLYIPLNFLGVIYREIKQSAGRHGPDVRAARPGARGGRRSGRAAARRRQGRERRAGGALRARRLRLRRQAADPVRRRLRDRRRPDGRRRRAERAPASRRSRGCCSASTT